jgi:hypothetical protein
MRARRFNCYRAAAENNLRHQNS